MKASNRFQMTAILGAMGLAVLVVLNSAAFAGPYDAWTYHMDLTLDKDSALGSSLSDFPMLVKLTPGRTNSYAGFSAGGADLRFSSGGTALDFEIEKWNSAGDSYVWVKAPSITTGGSTTIRTHWGNASPGSPPSGNAWSNSFAGVWHMSEINAQDSTTNANSGTAQGGNVTQVTGQIDGADDFDGLDDYVNVPHASSLNFAHDDSFSLSAWVNILDNSGGDTAIGKWAELGDHKGYRFGVRGSGTLDFDLRTSSPNYRRKLSTALIDDDNWHHVAGTYNGNGETSGMVLYIDGDLLGSTTTESGGSLTDIQNTDPLCLGADMGGTAAFFDGIIDEARVSSVVRSADWVKGSYLSGDDNFIAYGQVVIPEPSTLVLLLSLGATSLLIGLLRRRRRRA